MKIFTASDIHGSAFWCKKIVERFTEEKADVLLLLGDILYHGPRNDLPEGYCPKEVIPLLNGLKEKIVCVRGNCDAEVDQMVLDFSITSDYKMISSDSLEICATHGHLPNERLPKFKGKTIILSGHTHIPLHKREGEFTYLNPGSVSIPKADSPHSYMIIEDNVAIWKDADGNVYDKFELK